MSLPAHQGGGSTSVTRLPLTSPNLSPPAKPGATWESSVLLSKVKDDLGYISSVGSIDAITCMHFPIYDENSIV